MTVFAEMRTSEFERLGERAVASMGQTSGKVCDCRRTIVHERPVPDDGIWQTTRPRSIILSRGGLGKVNLEIIYRVSADR
jgi:hypothetical protein